MLKTLGKQIKQYKKPSVLAALFTVFEVMMEVLIPLFMASIIDLGIEQGNMRQVYRYGGCMLLVAVLGLGFGVLAGKYAAIASAGVACNLRDSMYEKIQTFSFSNIDKYSSAGLITRLTTDVTNLQSSYQMIIRMCIRAPISMISALVMAVIISPRMSLVFIGAIVFLAVVLALIVKGTISLFAQVFEQYDDLNSSIQENVSAIRVVKAYVREDHEKSKFDKAATKLYQMFVKAESRLALNNPAMMFTMYSCILAISWVGAKQIVGGSLTTGELTSLFSYVMNILMSLMLLSMIVVMVSMSIASARRIAEILKEEVDLKSPEHGITEMMDGSVEFGLEEFAYRKKPVLKNIYFHVNPGEVVGIIGSTGSSKSSLVNLISRLYDVTGGFVKVGGRDVREYDLTTLRDEVAVVLQKNELFSGTILENLRWGKEDATEEECRYACKLAQADEFISQLPNQYHTYLERGGTNISGGQKQRLCIARALLKSPKVLILDDSTSAVDTATESRIREALQKEQTDVTKFIIAQRVSSIQDADKIIVLDDGEIDGFGTHGQLLESNDIYRSIYRSQTQG